MDQTILSEVIAKWEKTGEQPDFTKFGFASVLAALKEAQDIMLELGTSLNSSLENDLIFPKKNIMDEFIKFVAENWENKQEYAGCMETWCFYCGKYQERGEPESHEEGCLHVKALLLLLLRSYYTTI